MIEYNNLSDNQKQAIREYEQWAKSTAPIACKMAMLERCYKVLVRMGIEKFVW